MRIRNFAHKGLKLLYADDSTRGVPADSADKLRKMLSFPEIVLRVSRPALSSLLNAKADLSGDMALRMEKAFGVKMDTLMGMQASFDIARTRKREKQIRVERFHQTARA